MCSVALYRADAELIRRSLARAQVEEPKFAMSQGVAFSDAAHFSFVI
jgi:hypothetical protein